MSAERSGANSVFKGIGIPALAAKLLHRPGAETRWSMCERRGGGSIVGDIQLQPPLFGSEEAAQRPVLAVDVAEQAACHVEPDQRLEKWREVFGGAKGVAGDAGEVEDRRSD
jgi:hypothetical protein